MRAVVERCTWNELNRGLEDIVAETRLSTRPACGGAVLGGGATLHGFGGDDPAFFERARTVEVAVELLAERKPDRRLATTCVESSPSTA
ncbi:hypothetical protein [Halalkalicoccus salilacus]|uniref:hypothetical protein n=1 Tax=Halalkalicoccus TaxID=332246 RepID=UPI002F966677